MARQRAFNGPGDPRLERALCIVAHPDDVDFFAAGTVLLMTRRGIVVDLVLATSGDKGSRDGATSAASLAAAREREQLASAAALGASRVEFLRHRDAELVDTLEFRGELVREIRRSRPDVLLTFDPTPGYRQHPDHRVVGRVALDAAWPCARDPLTYPDMGSPHETAEAWLFGSPRGTRADLTIDVGEVLDLKITARLAHQSQTRDPHDLKRRWRRIAGQERFVQVDLR